MSATSPDSDRAPMPPAAAVAAHSMEPATASDRPTAASASANATVNGTSPVPPVQVNAADAAAGPSVSRASSRDLLSPRRQAAMALANDSPSQSPLSDDSDSADGSDRVLLPSNSFEHVQIDDRAPPNSFIRIDREGNSRRSKSAQLQLQPGDLMSDAPASATLALPPLHKGAPRSDPASSPDQSDAESDGKVRVKSIRRSLDAPLSVLLTPADDGRRSAPRSRRESGNLRPDLPLSPSPPTGSAAALVSPAPLASAVLPPPSALLPQLTPDTEIVFDFQCEGLDRMHLLYKASPYLELYQCARSNIELKSGASRSSGRGNFFESVYKTETILHKLHPVWKRIVVSAHALCRCEWDRMIMIRVWDESRSGDDALMMGECQATMRDLLLPLYSNETDALRIPLVRPELKASKTGYTNSGFLVVTSVARYHQLDRLPGAPKPKHRRTTSSARASKEGGMPAVNAAAASAVTAVAGAATSTSTDRERKHLRHKSSRSDLLSPDDAGQDKEERRRKKDKEKDGKKKSSKPSSRSHSRDVSDSEDDPVSAASVALSLASVSLVDFVPSYLSLVGVSIHGLSKSSWLSAPNPFFVIYGKDSVDRAWRDKYDKDGRSASAEAMRVGGAGSGKPEATIAAALAALVAPPAATTAAASVPAAAPSPVPAAAPASTPASVPANPILSALVSSPAVDAWIPQWTSEVKNNTLAADFDPFVLDVSALINGDWDQQIKVAVCSSADDVKIVKPELIGSCTISVREFLTGSASVEESSVDSAPLETVAMNPNQKALIAQRMAQQEKLAARPASAGATVGAGSAPMSAKIHSRKKSAKHRAELTLIKPVVPSSKSSPSVSPSPPLPACTFQVRSASLLESLVGPRLHSFADDADELLKEMAMVRVGAFGSAPMTPPVRSASPVTASPSPPPMQPLPSTVTNSASSSAASSTSASASSSSSPSSSPSPVCAPVAAAAAPPSLKRFATLSSRDGGVVFVGGSATNGGNEEKGHSRRATLDRRLSLEKAASVDTKTAASADKSGSKEKDKPASINRVTEA